MKDMDSRIKQAVHQHKPIYARALITLDDGNNTSIDLTSHDDFYVTGNSFSGGSNSSFPLGECLCETLNITIDNSDERYSQYDFYGARIYLYFEIDVGNNNVLTEFQQVYTVTSSTKENDTVVLEASDDITYLDVPYTPEYNYITGGTLQFPCTLDLLIGDIAYQTGLWYVLPTIIHSGFSGAGFTIKDNPKGYTCREIIGFIAQLYGGNFLMKTGQLPTPEDIQQGYRGTTGYVKQYDVTDYSSISLINGGRIPNDTDTYINGGELGVDLNNIIDGDDINSVNYIVLSDFTSDPDIGTDEVTITGVRTVIPNANNEDVVFLVGTDDYAIEITNPLLPETIDSSSDSDLVTEALQSIYYQIGGMTIRPFSGSFSPNPLIEFMDTVLVIDRKYNVYQSFVSSYSYNFLGTSDIANYIESPREAKSSFARNDTRIYKKINADISKERTARQQSIADERTAREVAMLAEATRRQDDIARLQTEIANAKGLYVTADSSSGSGTVYILHDEETLADSTLKITLSTFGISMEQKENNQWVLKVAIQTDGDTLIGNLNALGVTATNQITAPVINCSSIQGGFLTLGGDNNIYGQLQVKDSAGDVDGKWDTDGIYAPSFYFKRSNQQTTDSVISTSYTASNLSGLSGNGLSVVPNSTNGNWFGVFGNTSGGGVTNPIAYFSPTNSGVTSQTFNVTGQTFNVGVNTTPTINIGDSSGNSVTVSAPTGINMSGYDVTNANIKNVDLSNFTTSGISPLVTSSSNPNWIVTAGNVQMTFTNGILTDATLV